MKAALIPLRPKGRSGELRYVPLILVPGRLFGFFVAYVFSSLRRFRLGFVPKIKGLPRESLLTGESTGF